MNIAVQNVSMIYPTGEKALHDVSLELQSPNLVGLLGPSGAEKSALTKFLEAEQNKGTHL